MQYIADTVNSILSKNKDTNKRYVDCTINSSTIRNVQGRVYHFLNLDGWVIIILNDGRCITLKFSNGRFSNEGYVMNEKRILKVFQNNDVYEAEDCSEATENRIVDLDHGTRFEGTVLKEDGIPFGFGELYDDDGLLVYQGILINWKRFGYGVSYRDNASVEYKGYWCDDKRNGLGRLYDRSGKLVKEGEWLVEAEKDIEYVGNNIETVNIGIEHLHLRLNSKLDGWIVSWFYKLESIDLGDNITIGPVTSFQITGLNQLRSLKIGSYCHLQCSSLCYPLENKTFVIHHCYSLEVIEIGVMSFCNLSGIFQLNNLASLKSFRIGSIYGMSSNFANCSFVLSGIELAIINLIIGLPKLETFTIGNEAFKNSPKFSISNVYSLMEINIGNSCFKNASSFHIHDLDLLKHIRIGKYSFTETNAYSEVLWQAYNRNKHFVILRCPNLEYISLGEYSFSDFAGQFTLKDLDSLQILKIGNLNTESRNFYYCSFVLCSKLSLHYIIFIDLPGLESVFLGEYAFCESNKVKLESNLHRFNNMVQIFHRYSV